jgi:hypothetical protein
MTPDGLAGGFGTGLEGGLGAGLIGGFGVAVVAVGATEGGWVAAGTAAGDGGADAGC